MAETGCAVLHTVLIYDRGGVKRVAQLRQVTKVKWGRLLNGTSTASATVSGRACRDQAAVLGTIEPHRSEMVIYRGAERVWEGPVGKVTWYSDQVEVTALDIVKYLDGTPLSKDWPNEDGGGHRYMTERIDEILTHELTTDYTMTVGTGTATSTVTVPRWETVTPAANILPFLDIRPSVGTGGILTRAETMQFEMTLGEHLGNLARGGLDYTTVGRRLLIWDSAEMIGRLRVLTDADFYGDITIIADGTEQANIAHVSATNEGDDTASGVGNAGAADAYYGVWTRITSLQNDEGEDAPSQDALNSQAQRQLLGRTITPTRMMLPSSAGLRLSHDVTINQLVAGVHIPVRAVMNLRQVSQVQQLDELTVSETADGETIQVSLSPVSDLVV